MPRTPRLVLPLFVLLLLAACAAPPRPLGEGRGEGGSATASPTPLPPTATPLPTLTSTPTAAPPPTATPLPAPIAPVLKQLENGWGLAAEQVEYAPASEAEAAHLAELAGVQAEDLGAVFKVKTAEGSLFWATEREGAFAVRQVPAYERYENGQPVAVPAHEEAVAVKRMLADPTEFGHWNGGKVVEVQTAEGTGWYYPGEKGEWEKIYESGFDYELLYRQSVAVLERLGKLTPNEANDPKIVHDRLQQFAWERTKATGDYAYVGGSIPEEKLLNPFYEVTGHWGLDLGARWIHFQAGGKEANGLVLFDLRGKNRRNDVESVVYPLLLGFVADGQWQPTIFEVQGYGWPIVGLLNSSWRTQRGRIQFDAPEKIRQLFNDNLGKEMIAQGVMVVGKDFVEHGNKVGAGSLSPGQKWIMDHLPQSYVSLFSRDKQARLELSRGDILKRLMQGEMEIKAIDVGLLPRSVDVDDNDFQVPDEMRGGLEK